MDEHEIIQRIAEARGLELDRAVEQIAELERELRPVVDAAREFAAADTAWHAKIERGENVRSTDDESRRRAGAILALLDAVRQLDGIADMGGGDT